MSGLAAPVVGHNLPGASTTSAPSRHIDAFDGIRGVAILWVILHNATDESLLISTPAEHVLNALTHPGWIGVQLFFGLSGFLITAGLLEAQGAPHYFRNFYAKRALRILPLYYAVLLAFLVVLPLVVPFRLPYSSDGQASMWLFTANWTHATPYGFAHFWSLMVEEQFYLFWPLVVFRLSPQRLLPVCLWIAAGSLLLRTILAAHGTYWFTLYSATSCRMDALALGGAGACVMRLPSVRRALQDRLSGINFAVLVIFLAGIPLTHSYDRTRIVGQTLGYSLLALCCATFVTTTALADRRSHGVQALLRWRWVRSCGRYSYAMYVFHGLLHKFIGEPLLVGRFGERLPGWVVFVYALVLILASYLAGFCSYHLLEKHFLRLKRYLEPAPTAAQSA